MLAPLTSQFTPRNSYDVAIIGAGPAGLTLALALAKMGRSVFLAEGGDLERTDRSQDIYKGRIVGDQYFPLDEARLRYFGGTSGHWGGICRPFDAQDLAAKRANADTAWPIGLSDLAPYQAGARAMLNIPPFPPDQPLPHTNRMMQNNLIWSDPVRFGTAYRKAVADSSGIDGLYNCNFMGFDFSGGAVKAAHFVNWDHHPLVVHATQFVVACGGIENSRVLLLENRKFHNAMGNQGGAVGAYWMDHPAFEVGEFVITDRARFKRDPLNKEITWAPTPAVLASSNALNSHVKLYPADGAAKKLVKDLMCMAPKFSAGVLDKFGHKLFCTTGSMVVWGEQEPRESNRIQLDDTALDEWGRPRIKHNVHMSPLDAHTIRVAAWEAARYMAQENIGRAKLKPWVLSDQAQIPLADRIMILHLMGGTRMATSPAKGVVDRDCKVFGTQNLYVGGSSVFPSGSYANPTYTIVQLALRLATTLNQSLSTPAVAGKIAAKPAARAIAR